MTVSSRFGVLRLVVASCVAIVGLGEPTARATPSQVPGEVVVEGGMQLPSSFDLDQFFAHIDLAFVGSADTVAVQFLGQDHDHPFTRMTFRPTEIIKGSLSLSNTVDVWTYGGTYVDRPAGREVLNPAGIAREIQKGASYFVPVTHLNTPQLDGKFVLAGDDALAKIDATQVSALSFFRNWVSAVIANGRAQYTAPGPPPADATLFLNALRSAASR
jgi:hypothetical protein